VVHLHSGFHLHRPFLPLQDNFRSRLRLPFSSSSRLRVPFSHGPCPGNIRQRESLFDRHNQGRHRRPGLSSSVPAAAAAAATWLVEATPLRRDRTSVLLGSKTTRTLWQAHLTHLSQYYLQVRVTASRPHLKPSPRLRFQRIPWLDWIWEACRTFWLLLRRFLVPARQQRSRSSRSCSHSR
jgi:hypothetical protein